MPDGANHTSLALPDADERPGICAEDRPQNLRRRDADRHGGCGYPAWAATSLAKSAQRASLTRPPSGRAYQKTSTARQRRWRNRRQSADPGLDPLLHFTAVGAQRPLQLSTLLRQHVPGIASLDPRHAEHHRVEGVHLPAGHTLCSTVTSWLASRIATLPSCGRAA